MSIQVVYITTARSDYGPAYWLIHDLFADHRFEVRLVVGGAHLSRRHGLTVTEIEEDGWPIAATVPFLEEGEDDVSHGRSCGKAMAAYAELFDRLRPQTMVSFA